jgi:RNase_H superfamily
MTIAAGDENGSLARRLERFRAATRTADGGSRRVDEDTPGRRLGAMDLAARLAGALDAEVVRSSHGIVVRCESGSRPLPVDRARLAALPGQPPPDAPLVCLDTETTGLATATGTVAFLIGLGWWEGERFRQVQLLLPDHAEERALLDALTACIPADAWLVTYNGRGFDWPLLVTRYRMQRRPAPEHGGHVDLLPIVRRLFRHRLEDARLRTAESGLLGLERHGDVDGWEIPARYLGFLRGGPVGPLVDVVRHNDQDVRSLGHLLAYLETGYATGAARRTAPPGDLGGLARAFARSGRLEDALDCYDAALESATRPAVTMRAVVAQVAATAPAADVPWWAPAARPDFGGRAPATPGAVPSERSAAFAAPWTSERIAVERAYLLRRLGRWSAAADAWDALAAGPGRTAIVAAIELAKVYEHRHRDPQAAIGSVARGLALAERRRALGRPEPRLEADLRLRGRRLRRRLAARRGAMRAPPPQSIAPAVNEPTCESALGTTARRSRSRARRILTAARSGTPSSPMPSTASEPAAAANRRS